MFFMVKRVLLVVDRNPSKQKGHTFKGSIPFRIGTYKQCWLRKSDWHQLDPVGKTKVLCVHP